MELVIPDVSQIPEWMAPALKLIRLDVVKHVLLVTAAVPSSHHTH